MIIGKDGASYFSLNFEILVLGGIFLELKGENIYFYSKLRIWLPQKLRGKQVQEEFIYILG